VSSDGAPRKRKPLSAAALKHIRDAQKKRWAAFHAKQKPEATGKAKRKVSAAARRKLAANLAKARAARAAKAAA
jgi:hypothetical protein